MRRRPIRPLSYPRPWRPHHGAQCVEWGPRGREGHLAAMGSGCAKQGDADGQCIGQGGAPWTGSRPSRPPALPLASRGAGSAGSAGSAEVGNRRRGAAPAANTSARRPDRPAPPPGAALGRLANHFRSVRGRGSRGVAIRAPPHRRYWIYNIILQDPRWMRGGAEWAGGQGGA